MMLVRFSRDMAPHKKGDTRLVPDDVAETLQKNGDIDDAKPFPAPPVEDLTKKKRPVLGLGRPGKTYSTR